MITFVVLDLLTGNSLLLQVQQTWAAHFASGKSIEYGSADEHGYNWTLPLKNWDITVPALIGVCILCSRLRRDRTAIIPVAWFGLSFAIFGLHKPWWAYYYVHNAIPLCWCAAVAIGAVVTWICSRWVTRAAKREALGRSSVRATRELPDRSSRRYPWWQAAAFAIFILGAAGWMSVRLYLEEHAIRSAPKLYTALVLKEIERFKPFTKSMFTDQPVYSFHADLPMPPHLGLISLKRFWTGDLSNSVIATELEDAKPGLILLGKESQQVPYEELMTREYRLVYQDGVNRLYAHESIAKRPLL